MIFFFFFFSENRVIHGCGYPLRVTLSKHFKYNVIIMGLTRE